MFGKDFGELAGLVSEEDSANGLLAYTICEGCGIVGVDHEGRAIERLGIPITDSTMIESYDHVVEFLEDEKIPETP